MYIGDNLYTAIHSPVSRTNKKIYKCLKKSILKKMCWGMPLVTISK